MICSLVIEGVAPEWFCIETGMQQNFACPVGDDDEGICQKFVLHVQSFCFAYLKNLLPPSSS